MTNLVHTLVRWVSLGMPVIALAAIPIGTAQAQVVGVNAVVRNRVDIRPAGAAKAQPAVIKQRVRMKDLVQTQADSRLQMLLLDQSQFTIGPQARLTIDRFVYDPDKSVSSMGATVTRGAFRFMSGRAKPSPGATSINTPVASMGIRGTMVDGVVGENAIALALFENIIPSSIKSDPNTATLIILRGPGPRAAARARPGLVDVRTGKFMITLDRPLQAVYIPGRGMAPIGPFILSVDGLNRLNLLLVPPLSALTRLRARLGDLGNDPQSSTNSGTSGTKQVGRKATTSGNGMKLGLGISGALGSLGILTLVLSDGKSVSG